MNIKFFVCLLFSLQLFYWFVGRYNSKSLKGKDDYFLAGKSVRLFPLMMTFLATQVGGGIVLGAAEEAYKFGWPVLFYPLGAAFGLMLLGSGIGRKLAEFKVSTVAQIFEIFYNSASLKKIASILSILSLFMILVAQIIASNKFLVSLGFNNTFLFVAFWAIVILYTAQGGLKAVISTDLVQALFFSAIFLFCLLCVLFSNDSGFSMQMPRLESLNPVYSKLWAWLLMPLLFMVIEQDMGQRCFAGASSKIVSRASFFAGLGTMVVCMVPVFFGSLAKSIGLEIPQGSSVLIQSIIATTNPTVAAMCGCAVLAAIISTATSLINAISSNLSSDFELFFLKEKKTSMRFSKVITCMISISAIFFAFYFDNVVDLLIQSYELSVSSLFVPLFFALFKKKGQPSSAWTAIFMGAFGFIIFRLYPIGFPKEIASIALSFTGYFLTEAICFYSRSLSTKNSS